MGVKGKKGWEGKGMDGKRKEGRELTEKKKEEV